MKEIIKMLVVLTAICGVCGLFLAGVKAFTEERIEEQVLLNVKGPAVEKVLAGSDNDLIKDRQKIEVDGEELVVFVGKKGGTAWAVAYETRGVGFGGNIGVVSGFKLEDDTLTGIGITTHKETPGLGSRVSEDSFGRNFVGKTLTDTFKTRTDGGVVDAVTGATVSSRGVCEAVGKSVAAYAGVKSNIAGK